MTPPLYELSFGSEQPLPPIPAMRTALRLRGWGEHEAIAQLRRLVWRLKHHLGVWVAIDHDSVVDLAVVYPESLAWTTINRTIDTITAHDTTPIGLDVIDSTPINLREPRYRSLLLQHCNHELCRLFQTAPSSVVDETRQRIYSTKNIATIGNEAEVRRYLKFDFVADAGLRESRDHAIAHTDRLILCLDYANEYRSTQTLDQLDPQRQPLKPKQRLTQIYNGKSCEWVGWASVCVGEPIQKLGGVSLMDYHHRRGHLSDEERSAINPRDRAVLVRYGLQGDPVHHLPHVLKRLYERRDLRARDFDRYIVPIDQKIQLAIQSIHWLNRQGFCVGDRLTFETQLHQPPEQIAFNGGSRRQNLDFGHQSDRPQPKGSPSSSGSRCCVAEVWQGWSKRRLLERPDRIRTQVIYPATWEIEMRNYMNGLRTIFGEFGIALDRAGDLRAYDPLDRASLHATCDHLPDCDLVFAFVPTRDEPGFDIDINPYNTLKQHLFDQQIPSQMVTYGTARKAARQNALIDGVAQNVALSIIAKLGYIPWQIHDMPGTAEAFIGLDIGRVGDRGTVAAACIVDARGKLISWASRCLAGGETIGGGESAIDARGSNRGISPIHRTEFATLAPSRDPSRWHV